MRDYERARSALEQTGHLITFCSKTDDLRRAGMIQHLKTAYAALSPVPSGKSPVSRKNQSAMSNFRATSAGIALLQRCRPIYSGYNSQPRWPVLRTLNKCPPPVVT